mmetsp:Transcript_23831/g.72947  ORF Transcript_23831/g.72947 Transcript_23831/m.72947 type:complete len:100 (-) Transcript_23831:134-433(-)
MISTLDLSIVDPFPSSSCRSYCLKSDSRACRRRRWYATGCMATFLCYAHFDGQALDEAFDSIEVVLDQPALHCIYPTISYAATLSMAAGCQIIIERGRY